MPPIQALNALNVFGLRNVKAPQEPKATNPIQASAKLTPRLFNYSLSHPRAVDSEGILEGTSPLAKKLDICW